MITAGFPFLPEEDWHTLASRFWPGLTNEEKLRRLRATFHHAIVGEMRNSLPHIKIGTALLAFCALDFLGALAAGTSRASQGTFKGFCKRYLLREDRRYNCDRLWEARWRLVHHYSMTGGYFITWDQGDADSIHLIQLAGMPGPTIVLERFIDDIERAGEALFVVALSRPGLRSTMLRQADLNAPISFGRSYVRLP